MGTSPFESKVALITGASSGIGAALALELARRGASIALLARRSDRLERLAEEIRAMGRQAVAIACDVSRDGELERAASTTIEELGRIDIAVANAGFGVAGRIERLTTDDFRRQYDVNVFGVTRTLFATLGELKRCRGTFVIMGSVAAYLPGPRTSPYASSKAAVRSLAESWRAELAADGVAVVLISPGYVASEIRKVDNQGHLRDDAPDSVPGWLVMPADVAARTIARAIARRRREAVITVHGHVAVSLARHVNWLVAVVSRRFRRPRHTSRRADTT